MPEQNRDPPGVSGVDHLTHIVNLMSNKVDRLLAGIDRLEKEVKQMPSRQDLDAVKAALMQAIQDETAQVTKAIQFLKDQLAAGQPITDQDLTDLQTAIQGVQNIDPDQVAPTP